ncbi:MAG: hypothetical protein O3A63_17360 [Proteobacteria bacterium]|nr:hypothetical protein [Pseudomonadota bacterium]
MRISRLPGSILASLFLSPLVFFGVTAQAAEMQPPAVLEVYQCNYNPGKGPKDLMAARDYYVKQAEKAGITPEPSFIWNKIKGDAPIDFVWFTAHENLAAFGASMDAGNAAEALADVQGRFDAVADCSPGLATITPTFQRVAPGATGNVLISAFTCFFNKGVSEADMGDLTSHVNGVFSAMGNNAPQASYMISPITGANAAVRYLFSTFENATAWTSFVGAILASPDGQSLMRHRNAVLDCSSSLWGGEMVIGTLAN